jgi:hypothetical protein
MTEVRLDNGGRVAIAIPIEISMALADGHANTDRSDANTGVLAIAGTAREPSAAAINKSFLMVSSFVIPNKPLLLARVP